MDDPIVIIGIIVFILIVVWGWFRRWTGDYEDAAEYDETYDEGYSDDASDRSWSSSSRRSSLGGSLFGSSNRSSSSSSHSSSSSSSSVSKSKPTKTYDSPKIQSRGGFGRSKK